MRALVKVDEKKKISEEKKQEMNKPDFWADQARAVEISQKVEALDSEIRKWDDFGRELGGLKEFLEEAEKEQDDSIADEAEKKLGELEEKFKGLEFYALFAGEYDQSDVFLSIHAGTGGVDAQDWAAMLMRMYLRFAEKKGWKAEILDRNTGGEAGIKNATFKISGLWAYGYLKSENGVHRLVRISPFDAEAMRHTSFALVEVIPDLGGVGDVEIKDEDIRIDVFRSSGPGGQSVNTTDSAVRIVHIPTNIVVTCQNERSQHQNKENALKILKSKLLKAALEEKEKEERKLRGEAQKAEWGKQIRSYVLNPYKMVKDHRTDFETQDTEGVLNGDLDGFMEAYLKQRTNNK